MGKVISFANQKGGVAKTTSVFNVGVALSKRGKKTLMIDLDSQASLSISAGLEPFEHELSIVSVLGKKSESINMCMLELNKNLYIVTSRLELAQLEIEMIGRQARELILKRALIPVLDDFDYILIDCPPQLSILTINALSCSDYVIIPVKTDYLAYRGMELLHESIKEIQEIINQKLKILGIIATLYESRVKDDNKILFAIKDKYNVIATIKKLAIAKKGIYDGLTVADQSPDNDIAKEYDKVCEYIIKVGK